MAREEVPLREITIEEIYKDVQKLRDELQSHNHLDMGNAQLLTGEVRGILHSPNFVSGSSGWQLTPDGNFEGNLGTFRGDLIGNSIIGATIQTATSGQRITLVSNVFSSYDSSDKKRLSIGAATLIFYNENEQANASIYGFTEDDLRTLRIESAVFGVPAMSQIVIESDILRFRTNYGLQFYDSEGTAVHYFKFTDDDDLKTFYIGSNTLGTPSVSQFLFDTDEIKLGVNLMVLYPGTTNQTDIGTGSNRIKTLYLINEPDVSSSLEMKKNIKPSRYGLEDILKLNSVEYKWKEGKDNKGKIGFIAEEIKKVIPEVAPEKNSYRPTMLISVLVKSIQELNKKIETLEAKT